MSKVNNISMKRNPKTKIVAPKKAEEHWDLLYFNYIKQQECVISESWIEEFCKRYVDWALNDPKATNYKSFYIYEGICRGTLDRWKETFPLLKKTVNHVKEIIGTRREQRALTNQYNASVVMQLHPTYDVDLKELIEWRSELRQKEDKDKGNVTVIMEKFAESESVPLKKSPEEVAESVRKQTQSAQPIGKVRI